MAVVGRLKEGDLYLAGELDERSPSVKRDIRVRYIRDWTNGSTSNSSNHWVEIQAIDEDGVNVALGKTGTSSTGAWSNYLTDGSTATSPYWGFSPGKTWVMIDLGAIYDLNAVKVWHYYGDGRTYHETKTEVSEDGENWYTIFDSAVSGTYAETSSGKTHTIPKLIAHFPLDGTGEASYVGVNYHNLEEVSSYFGKVYYKLELLSAWDGSWQGIKEIEGYINGSKQTLTPIRVSSETYQSGADYTNGKVPVEGDYGAWNAFDGVIDSSSHGSQWLTPSTNEEASRVYDPFPQPEWLIFSSDYPLDELWIYNGRYGDDNSTDKFKDFNIYISQDSDVKGEWTKVVSGQFRKTAPWLDGGRNKIKLGKRPSVSENVTFTHEGVSVDESTINIVPNPTIFSSGWDSYTNGNDGSFMTEFGVEGLNIVDRQTWCGAKKTITLPSTGTYTISVWAKPIKRTSGDISMSLYTSGGGISDTSVYADWSIEKIGKWQRLSMTRTYTTTNITLFLICFGGSKVPTNRITAQYTMPQIEKRSFPTTFTDGSRSDSNLVFDMKGMSSEETWTVAFDYKHPNLSSYPNDMVIASSYNGVSAGNWFGLTASTNTIATYGVSSPVNQWNKAVFVYNGVTTRLYLNGVKVSSTNNKTFFSGSDILSFSSMTGWGTSTHLASHMIRNLSVYKGNIQEGDIKKMSKMSIGGDGDLSATSLSESNLISNKNDTVYIPLGKNGNDCHNAVKPREDTLVYENGVAWAGVGTTNLASNVNLGFNGDRWETVTSYPKGLPVENPTVWRRKSTNTYWGSFSEFIPTSPTPYNRTFTVSFWYYLEEGYDGDVSSEFRGNNGDGYAYTALSTSLNSTFSTSKKGVWLYGEQTLKITTNAVSYIYFQGWDGGTIADGKHCYIANFQLEEKSFATPYVNGTRPYNRLNYESSKLTNNGFKEFTFLMWAKYTDQSSWQLSGDWNTWYFGAYKNSSLRFSWVEASQQSVYADSSDSLPIIPKGEWVQIGVSVKENQFIDIYYNGKRYDHWTGAFAIGTSEAPSVTEINSITETSTSYPLNAFVRDVIFVNKALTPEEVEVIYKTQMRDDNGDVTIQGRLKESSL